MRRIAPAFLLLLGACAVGDRQIETHHQPIVDGNTAYVPNCPDWSTAVAQAHEGQSSNFGCATMSNLAAMVADPQDLLHGRSDSAVWSDVSVKAVKAWRESVAGKQGLASASSAATGAK